jgi:hypothetical protein
MRILVILMMTFLIFSSCLGQKLSDSTLKYLVGYRLDADSLRKIQFQLYVDSLNNYHKGSLPKYLFDVCFDLQAGLWKGGLHSPMSIRWSVLEKVNNKKVLNYILSLNDKRLKRKCNYMATPYPNLTIPMIDKSFYDLIKMRYEQIK